MTDLLNRPSTNASSDPASRGLLGRALRRRLESDPGPRSLATSAAIAAVGSAAITLGLCMALALVGWYLADAGAHGQTTDALRVGTDVWLVGHGSGLTVDGLPLHVVPLTLSVVFALVLWRMGRWAAASSAPPEDDRAVALAATAHAGLYLVITVVTCTVVGSDAATPGLGRAIVGSLLLALLASGLGMASGTGHLRVWVQRVPGWVRSVAYGAFAGSLLLVVLSSLLVAVTVVLGINDASTLMSGLRLSTGDYVMYAAATVAVLPNAVLLGASYLLGPGFAVGTGTVVSPSLVVLGPVPAFPLLAALPESGPTPQWLLGALAVPVLVGMTAAVLAQRSYRVTAYDSAALRGFGSGLGAALLVTALVALAGGAMGTGRMADIGAPLGDVLVSSVASMSLGGLVAGLVTAWLQRRR